MLFSYNWLKEYFKGKFPSEGKLEELLNMHIFEVDGKERKNADWVFDLAVLPHRGDAASHYGLARELAALLGQAVKKITGKPLKLQKGTLMPLKVKVLSPDVIRYSVVVLEGVAIVKSPQWLRERLELLGINSINNVVDVTNYVMVELGQPLHAFDYEKVQGNTMLVRGAREGEVIETLDDLSFKLPKDTLVIEDKERLIDLAGMKGGKHSAIGKETKNVVLQAAVFSSKRIYKTKKQLGYTTPAADLYTKELDPNATIAALERAVELLSNMGGVKTTQLVDIYPKKQLPKKIIFNLAFLQRYLGASIPVARVKLILSRLGFLVKVQKQGWEVTVPTFRKDITASVDLIEEIARIEGYEKIVPVFPVASLTPSLENPAVRLKDSLKDALVEAGYQETYNYSFIGENDLKTFCYTTQDVAALVKLKNPYSEEYKYLRSNLTENLLRQIEQNARLSANKDIRVFEVGKAFLKKGESIKEWDQACGVFMLTQKDDQTAFAQAKGAVDFILLRLGINDAWYDSFHQTPLHSRVSLWHAVKSAEIKAQQKEIGFLGIVAPQIVSSLKLKGSVAVFSLDIQVLLSLTGEERVYQPISRFPAVYRDLALLVKKTTKVVDVMNVMHAVGAELIEDIDLFDMYEGNEIPEDKKSFAFHIVYQSKERTLTAKE